MSFCPPCRLSMAFSRQVFPVSGSERHRGKWVGAQGPLPGHQQQVLAVTFELAVGEALLAPLQEAEQALQLLAVVLGHGLEDPPAVIQLVGPLGSTTTSSDRVLGQLPGDPTTPSSHPLRPAELVKGMQGTPKGRKHRTQKPALGLGGRPGNWCKRGQGRGWAYAPVLSHPTWKVITCLPAWELGLWRPQLGPGRKQGLGCQVQMQPTLTPFCVPTPGLEHLDMKLMCQGLMSVPGLDTWQ